MKPVRFSWFLTRNSSANIVLTWKNKSYFHSLRLNFEHEFCSALLAGKTDRTLNDINVTWFSSKYLTCYRTNFINVSFNVKCMLYQATPLYHEFSYDFPRNIRVEWFFELSSDISINTMHFIVFKPNLWLHFLKGVVYSLSSLH